MDTSEQAALRRAQDIHDLRILAWCVQRDRYNTEPRRVEGGRRGKVRIMTLTYYVEAADYQEADRAVRELTSGRGPHTIRS